MRPPSKRGLTILETLIAMVILMTGLVGVLGALQQGALASRQGSNRQQKAMLADAALQRARLQDKKALFLGLPARPTSATTGPYNPLTMEPKPVGDAPWVVDPTPASADVNDLSTGAYFNILPDGTITPNTATAAGTACDDVAPGVVCREVYVHQNAPFGATEINIAGAQSATVWVRVARKPGPNIPDENDVLVSTVVVQ